MNQGRASGSSRPAQGCMDPADSQQGGPEAGGASGSSTPEWLQRAGLLNHRLNLICSHGTSRTNPSSQRGCPSVSKGQVGDQSSCTESRDHPVSSAVITRPGLLSAARGSQPDPSQHTLRLC